MQDVEQSLVGTPITTRGRGEWRRRGAVGPVVDEMARLRVDPLKRVPARRLRHPSDRAEIPDMLAPLLVAAPIIHGDDAVLSALDRDCARAESLEIFTEPVVVEDSAACLGGEHREFDQRPITRLRKDIEECGGIELVGVEVHQRGDLGIEDRVLGPHFPATEVLQERMACGHGVVGRREPRALQHERCAQLALGEFNGSARVVVAKSGDVLGHESDIGVAGRLVEDGRVVVPLADTAVHPAAARRFARFI